MTDTERPFSKPTWAIVELMGHVVIAGKVTDESMFGKSMLRIDHPEISRKEFTQFISPDALYRVTPTTEDIAREIAKNNEARPAVLYNLEYQLGQALLESGDGEGDSDELEYQDDDEFYEEVPL